MLPRLANLSAPSRRLPVYAVLALLVVGLVVLNVGRQQAPAATPAAAAAPSGPVLGPSTPVAQVVAPAAPAAPAALLPRVDGDLAGAGAPMRISVPSLGVDAPVLPISGESGVLEPPADPQELGWWQEGAVPGAARGSSVMTGHTVHTGGGALDHLARLQPGDLVDVTTAAGVVHYQVNSAWTLSKPDLATRAADVFAQDRPGRLILVTCFDWNGSEYLSNALVSALPIGSDPA